MPAFCPQCGTALKPDAQFCEECGVPVGSTMSKPSPGSARESKNRVWLWFVAGGGVILLIAGGLLFALQGWFDPDKRANQLFVEASQLVHAAQEAEQTSYVEAFKLYQAALANLDKITARYPSSQVAVQMTSGQAKVGSYTFAEFREAVPQAQVKAEAESDPFACILFVTRNMEASSRASTFSRASTLASLAGNYAEAGQKNKALELLSNALPIADTIADTNTKALALHLIAEAYAKAGDYDHALQLAHAIAEASTKATTLLRIVHAYGEAGDYDHALQVADTIAEARAKAAALSDIAEAYAKAGDYDHALQVAHTIAEANIKARALYSIAQAYVKAGQKAKALELLSHALQVTNTVAEARGKAEALLHIAWAYIEAGQKVKALELLSHVLQVANTVAEARSKASTLTRIAQAYAKANDYDHALQVANAIAEASTKAWALQEIAQVYAEAGQKAKALELLSRALQVTNTVAEAGEKAWALHNIAQAYVKARDYERALQVSNTITEAWAKAAALSYIAQAYAKAGDYEHALQVVTTIEAWAKAAALSYIAQAYAKAGDYEHALQVATTMENAGRKVQTWVEIIYTQAQDEQKENSDTKRILHDIIKASTALSDSESQARLKPEIAILGKWQNSKETVEFFKDGTVNFISDRSPMGGDYKIVDDTHVRLHLGGFGGLAGPMVWKFAVSGDQLTLNLPDGKIAMYRRVQ